MKVKLLNDGDFGYLLEHIELPIIVDGEFYDETDNLIAVNACDLNPSTPYGYYLFSPDEYEVINEI